MSSTRISPLHNGNLIRAAFAIESASNIIFATTTLLYPEYCLNAVVRSPLFITPTASYLLQTTATSLFALTVPLITCLPNTRRAIESRTTVYYTLAAAEVFSISLMVWKALARDETGLQRGFLLRSAASLVPILAWRVYTLLWEPEWFGVVEDQHEAAGKP
jgi:hypothetical protein